MKFYKEDAYFYETLCLMINWNLDRIPLSREKFVFTVFKQETRYMSVKQKQQDKLYCYAKH